ncbi:MAG: hypothetical protein ABW019_18390 [Chitinophagaceae bacterium]
MFNQNLEKLFFTNPGGTLGTSVYYMHQGGIIRAKTNANELHVRPGKNIYFIRDADANFFDNDPDRVAFYTDSWFVSRNNFSILVKLAPDDTYVTPVDMYLDKDGKYQSGVHVGHPVTNTFRGAIAGSATTLTLDQVVQRIAAHVNDTDSGNFSLTTGDPITI